ncbi:GGDEF domain-containing protein [Chromobacterium paludis]|nr:GGDEF domain-containing protein [Chromobacterium paludis]
MTIQSVQSILDFKTTLLSTTGYTLMLTLVVLLYWRDNRREPALLTLGLSGIISAAGSILAFLSLPLSPWHSLILVTLLLLMFHPMALLATRQLFGLRDKGWFCLGSAAVVMVAFVWLGGEASYGHRVMVTSFSHMVFWSLIVAQFWRSRTQATPIGHWLATVLACLIILISASRFHVAWWMGDAAFASRGALFNLFTSLSLFWLTFCFSLSMLFICYERLHMQLRQQADQDGLTRLLNHRTFQEKADGIFRRAVNKGESLSLLLIDLDHFKSINDRYGHLVGDGVLKQLADCLRREARHGDLLGRHGGEEFVVLLPQAGRIEAYNVADRLRLAIGNLCPQIGELSLTISASIGVASLRPSEHESLASLFLEADLLLYQAKRNGRNRVEMERVAEPLAETL